MMRRSGAVLAWLAVAMCGCGGESTSPSGAASSSTDAAGARSTSSFVLVKGSGALPGDVTVKRADPATEGGLPTLERRGATVGKDLGQARGPDRRWYRAVELSTQVGDLRAGYFLLDASGRVIYVARAIGAFDAPESELFDLIIEPALRGESP